MTDRRLAAAAIATTVVLWASAFVGIRAVAPHLSAGPLSLARLAVGSLALGTLMVARRERLIPRGDLRGLVICGVLWFGAYNVLLNQAERTLDAGTAALLVNTGPIVVAVLAGLVLHEGFPRRLVVGGLIAFAGAVVIGLATSRSGLHPSVGALLCIAAAFAYAAGVVAQKPLLARTSALSITWSACTIGAVVCLPFLPQLLSEAPVAGASTLGWVLYLGIFPTAVGFTTWAFALARTTAGKLGATTYLVPPMVIILAWLLLRDVPPLLALVGGAICLIGVAVARGTGLPRLTSR